MTADDRPIGVIAAIPEEIRALRSGLGITPAGSGDGIRSIAGQDFLPMRLDGVTAVVAETGIGKVNAAITATVLFHAFDCRALIFTGVAGGLDPQLGIGDVVVGRRLVQHDYGATVDGATIVYQPGNIPFPGYDQTHGYALSPDLAVRVADALAEIVLPPIPSSVTGMAERPARVVHGTILTGDTFINCEATRVRLHAMFNAQAVEMEGGSVAQVAERFGRPSIVVRCLSDLAGSESHIDFGTFLPVAADIAARIVRRIIPIV